MKLYLRGYLSNLHSDDFFKLPHDSLDRQWVSALRSKNPDIKIVPRLSIDYNIFLSVFNVSGSIETEVKMLKVSQYLVDTIKACFFAKIVESGS